MATNYCKECGEILVDVNEHTYLLRFGPPSFECQNPNCPANPHYDDFAPYFEWICHTCGMRLPSTQTHCPNNHWASDFASPLDAKTNFKGE